jgi:hypothetical protein
MVFNATFNNISVISWQSVLLLEEPGIPGGNHGPVVNYFTIYEQFTYYTALRIITIFAK